MTKRWMAGALVTTVLLAGCGGGSGSEGADDPTTTKAPAAESTTTTTEVDLSEAAGDFQTAAEAADEAIADEIETRDGYAADNDLDGGIDSTRDLRNDLFDFDAEVREIEVPADQQAGVNDVLTETGRYIEVLDGYQEITDVDGYNAQLDDEAEARVAWYEAVNALADDLDADGIENEIDGGASTTEPADDSDEEVAAGDTLETSTASMEVPEGFSGPATFPIRLTNEDGATVGISNVFDDEATTLEEVAASSAEGAADKNGYEVIGSHEEMTVGEYDALGWAFDDGDGTTIVDIYFEAEDSAGGQWHVVTVEASEDDIDQVMEAVEAVLDTVVIS